MQHRSTLVVVAALSLLGAACGSSSGSTATTAASATTIASTTSAPDAAAASTTVASTAAATGSSGDSQTADGKAFVAAIMAQPNQDSGFTEVERQCISAAVVDSIGLQTLKAAGITPDAVTANTDANSPIPNFKITDSQADGIVTGMFKCADMGAFLLKTLAGSGKTPLPIDKAACLSKAFAASPEVRNVFKVQLTGGDTTAAQTALQNAVLPMAATCNISVTELSGAFGG
jgi:hypothetical protein